MPKCQWCGKTFEGRADAVYCSGAHRQAAHRARHQREPSSYMEFRRLTRLEDNTGHIDVLNDPDSTFWRYLTADDRLTGNALDAMDTHERRALSRGSDTAGGYLAPDDFYEHIVTAARAQSGIAQVAAEIVTDTGNDLPVPLISAYGTAVWLAEGATITASDSTFGQAPLKAYKTAAKSIASEELAHDSGVAFDAMLSDDLGGRLGVLEATAFGQGDGSGKPQGLGTAAAGYTVVNATAGSATTYVSADIKAVYKAVPAAYRPTATWVMHPDDYAELVDTRVAANDAPAFPSLHAAEPTLYGRPVVLDAYMPTPAANAHSLAFGDIGRGYAIRRVRGVHVQRLEELHSDLGELGYRVTERVDGRPLLLDAIRLLRHTT